MGRTEKMAGGCERCLRQRYVPQGVCHALFGIKTLIFPNEGSRQQTPKKTTSETSVYKYTWMYTRIHIPAWPLSTGRGALCVSEEVARAHPCTWLTDHTRLPLPPLGLHIHLKRSSILATIDGLGHRGPACLAVLFLIARTSRPRLGGAVLYVEKYTCRDTSTST